MDKKKKYIIGGIFLIVVSFVVVIFVFSKSYALEGFGEINLSCDKTMGASGDNITCVVTGTVAESSLISSLSSQIELSDNLEFVSFTTNSIWNGDGNNGNIQLYGDNKSGTFDIGTFTVKVKEGVTNTTETVSLNNTIFYDDKFVNGYSIEKVSVSINTPSYSSDIYDLTKDYIIVDTKDSSTIINGISSNGCDVVVDNDGALVTTGNIIENSKLKIVIGDKVIKEFAIIYINSKKYDLSDSYIMVSSNDVLDIKNDIECINGGLAIKNNQLVLSYNNTGIRSYDILNIYSDVYKVNLSSGYILINEEIKDNILDNIHSSNNINLSVNNDRLDINYSEKTVKSLKILYIYSNKYSVDFNKEFVYAHDDIADNNIMTNILTNTNLSISDNKLKFVYDNSSLIDFDIINVFSDKYYIDNDNSYIYTNVDNSLDKIKSNIRLINGEISVVNDKLQVKYNENVVKEFELYYVNSTEYEIDDKYIYINELVDYNDFVNNIVFNGLTYKIFNASNAEVTAGNIGNNFKLKLYKGNKELGSYIINSEYLEINNLSVNEDDKIIYNLVLGTTYDSVVKNINTNGKIIIKDRDGEVVDLNSKVKTYDVITIKLSSKTVEYKVSVYGDVSGTGDVNVGDVAKLYQGVKGKISLDKLAILSGDVTREGEIAVNDVAKLYQYLKGKINSLD